MVTATLGSAATMGRAMGGGTTVARGTERMATELVGGRSSQEAVVWNVTWIIVIGFIAGPIARVLSPVGIV
jgi:hypothetical protein